MEHSKTIHEYTQDQFDVAVALLKQVFTTVDVIDYERHSPQGRAGWKLMLIHVELGEQSASFKVWVEDQAGKKEVSDGRTNGKNPQSSGRGTHGRE